MSLPKITVVMNSFMEHPVYFRKAVHSYLQQKGVDLELILSMVVGDENITRAAKLNVSKIVVNKRPGIYTQLNNALKFVTGDWFAYASSNDIADERKLADEYEMCVRHNKLVCYSSFHLCGPDMTPLKVREAPPYDYASHLEGNFINDCALVHASLLKKYAPFDTGYNNKAYHDFWLRIFEGAR